MTFHLHRYIELTAPLRNARMVLTQQPPFGGERLGTYWLWQGDLWQIEQHEYDDDRMIWQGNCPAIPGSHMMLMLTLHDAQIATHVRLHFALSLPASTWGWLPGTRQRQRRAIATDIDKALTHAQTTVRSLVLAPQAPPRLPSDPVDIADTLRRTHPHTVSAFEAMGRLDALSAVVQLDERWQATEHGNVPADVHHIVAELPPVAAKYDLVYAGGGLGLLHAAVMAQRYGYRVLLFDRGEVGCAHREWNIGARELQALIDTGFCTAGDLDSVIMRRYRDGLVRFSAEQSPVHPAELHLPDVLNVSIDAAALLRLARHRLKSAGATILDHRTFRCILAQQPGHVVVEVATNDGRIERYGARLMLDGMGATSPLALQRYAGKPFAGVCPTVGTVVSGLEEGQAIDQHHPDVGDILVSIADTQRERQLIWEGFAGRDDELTIYLFYYDIIRRKGRARTEHSNNQPAKYSLLDLFEDYFTLLPTYKRPGPYFRHLRPVYGFIPARHTQRRDTRPPLLGTLPIGDSSAQQSPLTFCGFGSHVRNLDRTTSLLDLALQHDLLAPQQMRHINAYQANVALNWVFSRFMQPWHRPNDVNLLQNVFARVLNELGTDVATRFFQDQMRWRDYGRIVNHTLKIYKRIIPTALTVLGPKNAVRWAVDWLRFSAAAATATLGRHIGSRRLHAIESQLWASKPTWAFALHARRAEWRAMGWDR